VAITRRSPLRRSRQRRDERLEELGGVFPPLNGLAGDTDREDRVVVAVRVETVADEEHVIENRRLYREKFATVTPLLASVLDVGLPDAGFYLWPAVGEDDTVFARELLAQYNVTVLPGSYVARESHGINPGAGRVRMALVAQTDECTEAAQRIVQFVQSRR